MTIKIHVRRSILKSNRIATNALKNLFIFLNLTLKITKTFA